MPSLLSDDQYLRLRDLLLNRCGLSYPERKRADLEHGVRLTMQTLQCDDVHTFCAGVVAGGPMWEALVEHLTIGETYFFRNTPQFDALTHHVLPDIITRRSQSRNVRIWSAACASGEEPYSIAMLLHDLVLDYESWFISILATDLNQAFLARARDGLYGEWSFRETSSALRSRFFTPEGLRWRLRPEIKRMVSFARLNLAEDSFPSLATNTTTMDLILCRNVMIYFDEATTRRVVGRLYESLAPGGWLLVGHSEPHIEIFRQFETHNFPNAVLYRKPLDVPLFVVSRGTAAEPAPPADKPAAQPPVRHHRADPPAPLPATSVPHDDLWSAAGELLERGDKEAAEAVLVRLLQEDPAHGRALMALVRLYADRGAFQSARGYIAQVIQLDPLSVEAHYLLAEIYEHESDVESALDAYRRTVFLNPGFIAGILGMARCWEALGRPAEAFRAYRNAAGRLSALPPRAVVPESDGATASELAGYAAAQLERLRGATGAQ